MAKQDGDARSRRLAVLLRAPSEASAAWSSGFLSELIEELHWSHRLDLTAYRPQALRTQLTLRMSVLGVTSLAEYGQVLREKPAEFLALLDVLLVGSTSFFRDSTTLDMLCNHAIHTRLSSPRPDSVRVWVPGCSTGEEAYSLAMLLVEAMEKRSDTRPLRIFATDIRANAVAATRVGLYPFSAAERIGEARLARFFTREARGFRVRPELRERLICGQHDLLSDPPFARLDLLSCRNVLLYMEPAAQRFVLERLHFALAPHGILMLGSAESTNAAEILFRTLDARHRLFTRECARLSPPGQHTAWVTRNRRADPRGPPQ